MTPEDIRSAITMLKGWESEHEDAYKVQWLYIETQLAVVAEHNRKIQQMTDHILSHLADYDVGNRGAK